MEPGSGTRGSSERAHAGWLLLPLAEEAPVETDNGLRGDRSNSHVRHQFFIVLY